MIYSLYLLPWKARIAFILSCSITKIARRTFYARCSRFHKIMSSVHENIKKKYKYS